MSRYRQSYKGVGDLLRSEMLKLDMVRRAEKVKAAAEAIAPYDPEHTEHYRDKFAIEVRGRGGRKKDRVVAAVVNSDDAAFQVEYGTRNNPRYRVLGRALDAAKE